MSDWNSAQYLKFEQQRTQPAIDLANRVHQYPFKNIADIGCGPGNSTAVLKSHFPHATILGIDSSANMIDKAKESHPELQFQLCDAYALHAGYDLLFSNACFQWIPSHDILIPALMEKLNEGGILAVQMPMNEDAALFKIIRAVAAEPNWEFQNDVWFEVNKTLKPFDYFNILASCASQFELWETVYYHNMPSHAALVEWAKGTRLRPYLSALKEAEAEAFEQEILHRVSEAYPVMENGEVILPFRRFFFVAHK